MELHVAKNGDDFNKGSLKSPFLTVSKAAKVAKPGDVVTVHEGIYRECVSPESGGSSDFTRITYAAAPGEKVVIKGSEEITGWEKYKGSVWKVEVDNEIFKDFNPFEKRLFGDWFVSPLDYPLHLGDVYLNGKSFYEAKSIEDVVAAKKRTEGFPPPWSKQPEKILHPEDTVYQWFAEVKKDKTIIYANFQKENPNQELVEINVRESVFYPRETGKDYIAVRGFELAQSASRWSPPTGNQTGLIGPHWAKSWIIEDCVIHDAKCSGISIGKEASTGDNICSRTRRKPGYQYQMESVFEGLRIGWSKEKIGSHIIRNNVIHDCGQNGIVGHMGCAFSDIHDNHIYNIAVKHEYFGYEIGGIKLHAPIDVKIRNNRIHNCTLGTWLDWQVQGTRISKNLYYENDRDIMIEVTHGPHLVDNNIFASDYNMDNIADGGAYVHNIFFGNSRREPVLDRATPYHFPHTTQVKGYSFVYGGDDRHYRNIFIGGKKEYTKQLKSGTVDYDGHPSSLEEYIKGLGYGDHDVYELAKEPVYIEGNAYLSGARAYKKEKDNFISAANPSAKIVEEKGNIYLAIKIPKGLLSFKRDILNSKDFPLIRTVEAPFDCPSGKPIVFDEDINGKKRKAGAIPGPFANLEEGLNKIKLAF